MKLFFLVMLLFRAFLIHSQELYFRQMPSDYGRDIQQIKILFQSADQMVWLGTDKGLYSFDGKIYSLSQRADQEIIPVSTISENDKGEIWAGYDDGYIQIVNARNKSHSITTDSIKGTAVTKILFIDNGDVIVSTYGKGLWKLIQNKMIRMNHNLSEQIDDIYDALIDTTGNLWLATDHGIWIYNATFEKIKNVNRDQGLPDEIVTQLSEQKNGKIWIGFYDNGFGRYESPKDSVINHVKIKPEDGNVVGIADGMDDEVWLATEKTIIRSSPENPDQRLRLPLNIQDRIGDILFDRTGNIWIASGNKLFIANAQIELHDPGLKGIQAISEIDNTLWLGCNTGLYSYDLKTGLLSQHLRNETLNILSIFHDKSGILWIGTFGQGLFVYDPAQNRLKRVTEQDNISNNSILNIDGYGNTIWLATLGGITEITWKGDPLSTPLAITLFRDKFNFPPGYVYDVFAGKDGKVWFGTDGKGLYYLDGNQLHSFTKPTQPFAKDSFDLRTIYSITEDEKNNIWVSSSKGNILKLDITGNIIHHISSAYGSLNTLNSSGRGEIVMVREGVIQINNPYTGISFFGPTTGLTAFSPNINSTARSSDGSVWIADTDKVIHYKPMGSDTSRYVQLHIVNVTPDALFQDDIIRLRHDSNFIDFRFTGLWYTDPQSVRYRYMLKGHDQDWIYTQEGRAVYSKLSPGNYKFIVEGSHNEDFSRSLPIQREIIVLPPFYFRWWFIAGSVILIAFLAYRYLRDRIHRINRFHLLEKEKTTLQLNAIQAQVNPHFLFNSFNTLSGIIEEDQEAAIVYVDQLSSFFRGVLLHRNAELISVTEEIEIMRNYAYILKKRYGDNIVINENIESGEGFIAPLTLQMLIENAVKHNIVSSEKPLNINISITEHWLTVSNPIKSKFQSMSESTGFGLSSLLTRYQYLTPAKIEIINDGNNFTVMIPIIQLNKPT